ncbi:hypothetical protein Bca4012_037515 [Brassica carinata]
MYRNHQRIHQLEKGVSVRPITGRLLEGRLINNNQPPKPIFLIEGDEYEFSVFSNYKCLLRSATTPSYLPDVVGQIRMLQGIKQQNPGSNTKITIGLMLNKSTMVRLTLWNKPAIEFGTLQCKMDRKFKVVIVTSIIPRLFKGN